MYVDNFQYEHGLSTTKTSFLSMIYSIRILTLNNIL